MRTPRLSRSVRTITWRILPNSEIPRQATISCSSNTCALCCCAVNIMCCVLNSCRSSNKRVGRIPKWCSINGCMYGSNRFIDDGNLSFGFSLLGWCNIEQHQQQPATAAKNQQAPRKHISIVQNGCRMEMKQKKERRKKKSERKRNHKRQHKVSTDDAFYSKFEHPKRPENEKVLCTVDFLPFASATRAQRSSLRRHVNCAKRNINRKV